MIIKAKEEVIEAKSIIQNGDTLQIFFDGGVTPEQLTALQSGHLDIDNGYTVYEGDTSLVEHSIILKKASDSEIADMKAALEELGIKKENSWLDAAKLIVSSEPVIATDTTMK